MNNYTTSGNCCNHQYNDNMVDQKNRFIDQQTHECEHARDKNRIDECAETANMRMSNAFSNSAVHPSHQDYNADYNKPEQHWQQHDLQCEQQYYQQHEQQPEQQHDGYMYNPRRTPAHPLCNYSDINDEQSVYDHMEQPGHAHLHNANYSKDISQCKMNDNLYHESAENLYAVDTIKKDYEIPHELKPDVADHSRAMETNMYTYNKKKSPFSADSVLSSSGASPVRYNNIYGDYEKYQGNEKDEVCYTKQRHDAYERNGNPLYTSSENKNLHGHCNSLEKKGFIPYESTSPTKVYQINAIKHMNARQGEYQHLNNASNEYIRDDISLSSSIAREQRENASFFREKNMSHTKIFDYKEPDNFDETHGQKGHKKKFVDTFVPRYKNLSARETLLKNLSGNDNITVLAANSMEFDRNSYTNKEPANLPNVYPFNISERVNTTVENIETRKNRQKLLPANYNYVNSYTSSSRNDMSLSQIRNHMNSSHIFDTEESHQQKKNSYSTGEGVNNLIRMAPHDEEKLGENRIEKMDMIEKRKKNPMYTDMFGRKTPDVDIHEPQKEKLLSATMQNNWIYHSSDVKKYAAPSSDVSNNDYEFFDTLEPGQDKFHRKSYFTRDGYDNTKRLQDALKKGSTYALQAHLQSSFQSENEDKKTNTTDIHKVQIYYLTLYNLKDSVHDEDIKQIVKNSEAYLVSYKPHYDLLSNVRKSTAKLCIRHNKGKQGLEHLQHLFSQVQIKAVEQ